VALGNSAYTVTFCSITVPASVFTVAAVATAALSIAAALLLIIAYAFSNILLLS
jgi:hypothetical protein